MLLAALDLARPGLAERLLRLQRAAYAEEAALLADDRIPPLHETLTQLRDSPLRWLGAADGDRLLGALAWTWEGSGEAAVVDVHRLVVDPAVARRGVGRRLVQRLLDDTGTADVVVATGRGNRPARRLYESLGFVPQEDVEVLPGLVVTRYSLVRSATSSTS